MKILGMIGGTGPESTVEYYRRLIATYHARVSESGAPPIIINSVDNKRPGEMVYGAAICRLLSIFSRPRSNGSRVRASISR